LTNHDIDLQSTLSNQSSTSGTERLSANNSTESEIVSTSQIISSENWNLAAKENENQIKNSSKSSVVPDQSLDIPQGQGNVPRHKLSEQREAPLHIVWAHRW
jgi:hypothetical protein